MVRIVVDDEQKQVLISADGMVELADSAGHVIGFAYQPRASSPDFTAEEIAGARETLRDCTRWYSTDEVREHLAKLAAAEQIDA